MSTSTGVTAIATLIELANQVRQFTLQCLDAPDPSLLTWAPAGTSNHMLWHAGHVLWVQDLLTVEAITGSSELPGGWETKFGQDSQPGTTSDWPHVVDVRKHLEAQVHRIQELLTENERLIVQHAERKSELTGWQLLPGMIHGWHDEARHHGEMYLLLKLQTCGK